jgi:hypothetical protein
VEASTSWNPQDLSRAEQELLFDNVYRQLDVYDSVHHSTNRIKITNQMQTCTGIYYSNVLLIVQHVSSDTPLIIRSSKTVIAASGFTLWLQPQTYAKPEAAVTVFELLTMSDVSLETC